MSEHYDRALAALSRARGLLERGTITHDSRHALLGALGKVAEELDALEQERRHEVEPIAEITETVADRTEAAHAAAEREGEAAAEEPDAGDELRAKVAAWEATHPRLVEGIDELLMALRQMGI